LCVGFGFDVNFIFTHTPRPPHMGVTTPMHRCGHTSLRPARLAASGNNPDGGYADSSYSEMAPTWQMFWTSSTGPTIPTCTTGLPWQQALGRGQRPKANRICNKANKPRGERSRGPGGRVLDSHGQMVLCWISDSEGLQERGGE
jgi:hypothetical protein